jgi:hypothetical protein
MPIPVDSQFQDNRSQFFLHELELASLVKLAQELFFSLLQVLQLLQSQGLAQSLTLVHGEHVHVLVVQRQHQLGNFRLELV